MESAATIDVLAACGAIEPTAASEGKALLRRVVSMLTRMVSMPTQVREGIEYEHAYEYDEPRFPGINKKSTSPGDKPKD